MHVFAATIAGEEGAVIEAVVVQLVRGLSLGRTLQILYNDHRELRLRADVIIVRIVVEEQYDPDSPPASPRGHIGSVLDDVNADPDTTFLRANDKPVRFLGSRDFEIVLSGNLNPLVTFDPLAESGISDEAVIAGIREAEMRHIVGLARAMLPEAPGRAYRAPSGSLVRSFLRVGNIQFSRASLDALFFWLLPHLSDCGGILTDTWSISSLALNASRLLALYGGGPDVPVEVLSAYQDGNPAREAAAGEVLSHLLAEVALRGHEGRPRILCIISATQTGSLKDRLTEIASLYTRDSADVGFVALFKMGTSEIVGLSDWTASPAFQPLSDEDRDVADAVTIDPQLYFPLTFHDIDYELRQSQSATAKAFLDVYGGHGIINVHRNHIDDSGTRHHAIHLNTDRLVGHQTFLDRLHSKVLELQPHPAIVISPPHNAGRSLAAEAGRILSEAGRTCQVFAHSSLELDDSEQTQESLRLRALIDALSDTDAILIVDDTFITGTRLGVYERHLRRRTFRGRVHYLVGVARPVGVEEWEKRRKMRCYRPSGERAHFNDDTMEAVEQLFLPNWREDQCPWCEEQRLYDARISKGSELAHELHERNLRLQEAPGAGMQDDLFLVAPTRDPFAITRGSLFADVGCSQADVFASVASSIQTLRCSPPAGRPALGPRRFPVSTVLRGQEYLHDTYTDTILRAAILRASERDELTYADSRKEAERSQWLQSLITSPRADEWELIPEILVACASGKCALDLDATVTAAISRRNLASVAAALLPPGSWPSGAGHRERWWLRLYAWVSELVRKGSRLVRFGTRN